MPHQKAQNKASQPLSWENKGEVTISRSNILVEADCADRLVDDACSYLGCILSGIHKYINLTQVFVLHRWEFYFFNRRRQKREIPFV